MTRSFHFPRSHALGKPCTISLHEPALTADNLGFKTWASSYLLAKRLENIDVPSGTGCRVLELGAGTGLAGLAAAVIWGFSVHVTDLPEIVPNLARNVERNQEVIDENGGSVTTGVLDWSEETDEELVNGERYPIIITADPLYSPKHPELLSNTIKNQLAVNSLSRVIIELPLRDAYRPQVEELKRRMVEIGLRLLERGEETGYDDWGGGDGQHEEGLTEVKCWWGIWTRQ
jgi:predicted nicotinamide N-methyase